MSVQDASTLISVRDHVHFAGALIVNISHHNQKVSSVPLIKYKNSDGEFGDTRIVGSNSQCAELHYARHSLDLSTKLDGCQFDMKWVWISAGSASAVAIGIAVVLVVRKKVMLEKERQKSENKVLRY